jgi:two-component system response regulator VicR
MSKTVFVIDDSQLYIEIITEILKAEGMNVISTTDENITAEQIMKYNPDVVIIDMMLPHKNGVDIIRGLKSTPEFYNIPTLLVSSKEIKDIKRDHPEIDDYINKSEVAREIANRVRVYANIGSVRKSIRDIGL